jgi:hypothetical protein
MTANVEVAFIDGETAVVAFEPETIADAERVLCAWAVLWKRGVEDWKRTTAPATFWYDVARQEIRRYDYPYRDELAVILPHAQEAAAKFNIPFPTQGH